MKVGDLFIDESEIVESFVRASGPGGQNVNKVASAVELRFDARGRPSLPNDVAIRLIKLAGARATQDGVIVIFAQKFASQPRNREDARARLAALIDQGAGAAEAPPRDPPDARLPSAPRSTRKPAAARSRRCGGRLRPTEIANVGRRRAAGPNQDAAEPEIVVDAANELGEGVVWSPSHGEVQWTDIFGRRFFAYRPVRRRHAVGRAARSPRVLRAAWRTSLLAGFAGGLEVFDLKSGARRPIAAVEPDRPTTRVNDGKLDRRGRLVFGTMDEGIGAPADRPGLCVTKAARVRARSSRGVRISNSIAFSPDGRRMYFADTPIKVIRCYDYDLDTGELSGERMFAALVQGPGAPDGSTVDADGCLWNAEWGGGRVVRYTPDGRVDRVVALPCAQVTCCAFGGARLDRLFVTTARTGLDAGALAREPHAGALFVDRRRRHSASPIRRFPPRAFRSPFERSGFWSRRRVRLSRRAYARLPLADRSSPIASLLGSRTASRAPFEANGQRGRIEC